MSDCPTVSIATLSQAIDDNPTEETFFYRNNLYASNSSTNFGKSGGKIPTNWRAALWRLSDWDVDVPADAEIIDARWSGVGANNQSARFLSVWLMKQRDDIWDPASYGPAWRPADAGTVGTIRHMDFMLRAQDTSAVNIGETFSTTNGLAQTEMRQTVTPNRHEHISQSFTSTDDTNPLGDIRMRGVKTGSPTGDIWIEIYASDAVGLATGSVLATSDVQDVALWGAMGYHTFLFSGADRITLVDGTKYVAVIDADYSADDTNFVSFAVKFATSSGADYTGGIAGLFGTGNTLDDQNYYLDQQLLNVPTVTGALVVWSLQAFTAGVRYTSPDMSDFMQAYVNGTNYTSGDPVLIAVFHFLAGVSQLRSIRNFGLYGAGEEVRFTVTWRKKFQPKGLRKGVICKTAPKLKTTNLPIDEGST